MGMVQDLMNYFTTRMPQQADINPLSSESLVRLRLDVSAKIGECDEIRQRLTEVQKQIIDRAKPTGDQLPDIARYEELLKLINQTEEALSTAAKDKKEIASIKTIVGEYKTRYEEIIRSPEANSRDLEDSTQREIGSAGENAVLLAITVAEFANTLSKAHDKFSEEKAHILKQVTAMDDNLAVEQLTLKQQELIHIKRLQQRLGQGLVVPEDVSIIDDALASVQEKIANHHRNQHIYKVIIEQYVQAAQDLVQLKLQLKEIEPQPSLAETIKHNEAAIQQLAILDAQLNTARDGLQYAARLLQSEGYSHDTAQVQTRMCQTLMAGYDQFSQTLAQQRVLAEANIHKAEQQQTMPTKDEQYFDVFSGEGLQPPEKMQENQGDDSLQPRLDTIVVELSRQYKACIDAYSVAQQQAIAYNAAEPKAMSAEQFIKGFYPKYESAIFIQEKIAHALYSKGLSLARANNIPNLEKEILDLGQRYDDASNTASFLLNAQMLKPEIAANKALLEAIKTTKEKADFIQSELSKCQKLRKEFAADLDRLLPVDREGHEVINSANLATATFNEYEQYLKKQVTLTAPVNLKLPVDSPLTLAALPHADKKQAMTIEASSKQVATADIDLRIIVKAYVDKENDLHLRYIKQSGQSDRVEIGAKNKVVASLLVSKDSMIAKGTAAYPHLLGIAASDPEIVYKYRGTAAKIKAMIAVFEQQLRNETKPEQQKVLQAAFSKMTFVPDGKDQAMTATEFKQFLLGSVSQTPRLPSMPSRK